MNTLVQCKTCNAYVAASAGHAKIVAGRIAILCQPCASGRVVEPSGSPVCAADPIVVARPPRRRRDLRWVRRMAPASLMVPIAILFLASPTSGSGIGAAVVHAPGPDLDESSMELFRVAAPEEPLRHRLSIGHDDDLPVELTWYHPLAGPVRHLPHHAGRRFGAFRGSRVPRPECGSGHCGVDLGSGAGPVVHAVLSGTVTRIVRDTGARSGRYVRLEHPEGYASYYMHLDVVNSELEVGMDVAAGEAIGTIGSTGIHHSAPHLHFAVTRLTESGEQYVDPEPMLENAVLLEAEAPLQ